MRVNKVILSYILIVLLLIGLVIGVFSIENLSLEQHLSILATMLGCMLFCVLMSKVLDKCFIFDKEDEYEGK